MAIIANGLAIWTASQLIPDIKFQDGFLNLFLAGLVLGIVNVFIRPILKIISFPFILLSLGLFSILINISLLYLVDYLLPSLTVGSFSAAFWGSLVISFVNYFLSFFRK